DRRRRANYLPGLRKCPGDADRLNGDDLTAEPLRPHSTRPARVRGSASTGAQPLRATTGVSAGRGRWAPAPRAPRWRATAEPRHRRLGALSAGAAAQRPTGLRTGKIHLVGPGRDPVLRWGLPLRAGGADRTVPDGE